MASSLRIFQTLAHHTLDDFSCADKELTQAFFTVSFFFNSLIVF